MIVIESAAMALSDRLVLPAVRQLMADDEYISNEAIAQAAEVSPKTVQRSINRLIESGCLIVLDGGRRRGRKYGFPK